MTPPRWAIFFVGLLLVLALIEVKPRWGWPLLGVLMLGLLVTHPNVLNKIGFKYG